MVHADPVTNKNRDMILSGLASLGLGLFTVLQFGLNYYRTVPPAPFTPNTSAAQTVAQPIIEQTARFFSSSSGFSTANSAVSAVTTPLLHGMSSRASSAAGSAFTIAKGLSWTTLGIVGVAGTLGALYLAQRYWCSPSPTISNVNNNHSESNVNIHIHFDGKPDSIEQQGTKIFVKMPKATKCKKEAAATAA
jgi:hypothetical protein